MVLQAYIHTTQEAKRKGSLQVDQPALQNEFKEPVSESWGGGLFFVFCFLMPRMVILAFGRQMQEDQEFMAILGYIVSSRPT